MPFVPDPKRIEVVDEATAAVLHTKTPAERVMMAFEIRDIVCNIMIVEFARQHPDWTERQVKEYVAWKLMKRNEITPLRFEPEPCDFERPIVIEN